MNNPDNKIPENIWQSYASLFKRKEVPARTLLIREGLVSKKAFYIEKGCLRSWFNKGGKDITFQFFFEGRAVSSIESFRSGTPGLFNIETITPSVLHVLSKRDFDYILNHSEIFRRFIEQNTFRLLTHYQKLFLSYIKDTPRERYEELLKKHPNILQRVPLHYIASYLGISAVHLSRIRNRMSKNKPA